MKHTHLLIAAAMIGTNSAFAAVIDNTVITDFVDQTPGFNVARPLGVTITGDSAVYLVGTMNFSIEALGGSFIEANMGQGTTFNTGFGNGFGTTTIVIASDGTAAGTTQTFAEGIPTLLVAKFDQTTGATTLWVNPNLGIIEALNPADASATIAKVNGSTFDSVIFRGGNFSGTASVVDFTDFAVYYAGSTPFIPEPSSFALVALGGLVVLRRRR